VNGARALLGMSTMGALSDEGENDGESTVNFAEFVARQQTVRLS
jgi:hypothetical protein